MRIITRLWKDQPGKFFCISTKNARGRWEDHFFRRSEFNEVQKFIDDHRDCDLYFCPHGFVSAQRLKSKAALPSMLWADMDLADPRKAKIKPTIAIESSPGRFVGLWLLDAEMNEGLNKRLSYYLGCDKGGWDITQVLRIPGTINYKYKSLPKTRLLWSDGETYSIDDLEDKLPQLEDNDTDSEELEDVRQVYARVEKLLPHWLRRELMHGKPTPGKRSEMIWKICNTLIECGVSKDEAFVLLQASPWNKFAGRHSEVEQLTREIDKAVRKHLGRKLDSAGAERAPRREQDNDASDGEEYVWLARSLEDVEEANLDWLWYPYLARGELTILEGDPGLGKSYLSQMIAGAICDGKKLPSPDEGMKPVEQGRVAYFDIENSADTVTKKRMKYNGVVNMGNYFQEEGLFSIDDPDRMAAIYSAFEKLKPMLVVFDTVNTYLGKADAFKGHEAQQAFNRFKEIARRFNCAVLVLRHLTKGSGQHVKALYRGQGNIAFAGVARIVITMGVMPDDEDTRVFAVTKMNVAKKPKAHTFTIKALPDKGNDRDRSKFEWGEYVDISSDDIVAAPVAKKDGSEKKEAEEFLTNTLKNGKMEFARIERMAEARSISIRTLRRAADELGVQRKSEGFGKNKVMWWFIGEGE